MESVADMNKKGNSNMVTFATDRPIYLQICDRICNEILQEVYAADTRIPSVREYGTLLQVNPNTAFKAFEELSRDDIIYQRRGMGYYVKAGARERIMEQHRQTMLNSTLKQLFNDMGVLGISIDQVVDEYVKYQSEKKS